MEQICSHGDGLLPSDAPGSGKGKREIFASKTRLTAVPLQPGLIDTPWCRWENPRYSQVCGMKVCVIGRLPMSKYSFALVVLSLTVAAFSAPVFAHHGASAYDNSTLTTLSGTITDF